MIPATTISIVNTSGFDVTGGVFTATNISEANLPEKMWQCCSADCSYNNQSDCQSLYESFLQENDLVFTNYHVVRITLTWVLFFISAFGNLMSLWSLLKNMTTAQLIMMHITLADLAYTFLILPVDAMWQYTQQWQAGNAACKVLHVLKYFAMYSSSGMIMAMVLDRMLSLLRRTTPSQQRKQTKICILAAWLFAVINSIPAGILFGLASMKLCKDKCEDEIPEVTQCVDFGLVPDLRYYYIYTMMISFFIPITSIIICQTLIGFEIRRMAIRDREMMGRRHSETTNQINRARRKSLLLTILITTMFCVCWGPYYVRGLYYWFLGKSIEIAKELELWMLMSMYFNPCLHPLFFAIFMKDVRRPFVAIARKIKSLVLCLPQRNTTSRNLLTRLSKSDVKAHLNVTPEQKQLKPTDEQYKEKTKKKISFAELQNTSVISRVNGL